MLNLKLFNAVFGLTSRRYDARSTTPPTWKNKSYYL